MEIVRERPPKQNRGGGEKSLTALDMCIAVTFIVHVSSVYVEVELQKLEWTWENITCYAIYNSATI